MSLLKTNTYQKKNKGAGHEIPADFYGLTGLGLGLIGSLKGDHLSGRLKPALHNR